jgi:hypothetical protein
MENLQELLIKLEDTVKKEQLPSEIQAEVDEIIAAFESEIELINQKDLEDFVADGGEEGNFSPKKLPEQVKFKELVHYFQEQLRKQEEAIKIEQENNLTAKKEIIAELTNLIQNEEHIGKAFERFNELKEKWKSIGLVSPHHYKPLQADYSRLNDQFYYNIDIYKQLKDHDLKRNLQLREELIGKMEALLTENSIKNVQQLSGLYLSEWDEIGPINKEDWTRISDKFKTVTKKVFQRIKDHFNELKLQREKNLEAKQTLLDKAKQIVEFERTEEKHWKKATEQILDIQKEWRKIGFATKKENDKVWEDFRALCNGFFEQKSNFYDGIKESWNENKVKKEQLIEKAEALKTNTDWQETANQFIQLQKQWKRIGATNHKIEQKLWLKFRAAADSFFTAKKEYFDTLDDRLADNLKKKEEFLVTLPNIKLQGDKNNDRELLKKLRTDWEALGHVPKEKVKEINDKFNKLIDNLYNSLGKENGNIDNLKYEDKIEQLLHRDKPKQLLSEEERFLKGKMEQLTKEKLQYENNLLFFGFSKGKEVDKMKEEVNKKIELVNSQIAQFEKKLRVVQKVMRSVEVK